ncbi:dihydrolipoyl dehydrogenase family protein [Shumkonia mesophila]|uniref:dihydrolipoyl dehydrogenase family protein n=1 Tax=Shumkonia mesophila TaxID=2838854 RepID=UPI002934B9D2|nr:FAD-dependent oxidoreductase [Shumkonia mesophila]
MAKSIEADICVIGGGSGGLSVAAGASQMGARTVLVEKGRMGGDCLNYGCVPSKALLACGHAAQAVRRAPAYGVTAGRPAVDAAAVYARVHGTIAAIAPIDSAERFEGLGVTVIAAAARFTGPGEIEAGDTRVKARRFVVATGSSPFVPPIPGLAEAPYFTNETIFAAGALPTHLVIVGGGPIGIEMAQAHRQLGVAVSVLQKGAILPKDDPELVDVVRRRLIAEGVDLREGVTVSAVEKTPRGVRVRFAAEDGAAGDIEGSHILVAAGRRPTVGGLDLEAAGIAYTAKGIAVDARLRTTNRRVFAVGDVTGGYQFTHMAGYHAGIVIRNALFRLPAKVDTRAVPWVTYTSPELAQVGLTEAAARATMAEGELRILRWTYAENDRAQAEGETDGLIKVVATKGGRILGAGIAGTHAGETIQTWILAIAQKLKVGAVAAMIAPYPTLGEVNKRAAGSFYTPTLFAPRTRKLVRFLSRFG